MIVAYGTVCLDVLRRVRALPAPGGYVEIEQESRQLGGEAANTAAALRSWGAEVRLVGNSIGDSQDLRRLLAEAGLQDAALPDREHETPFCDIYITPDGERTMFGRGFREMELRHGLDLLTASPTDWLALDDNHGEASRSAARQHAGPVYALDFVRDDEPLKPGDFWQSSLDWLPAANGEWLQAFCDRHGCSAVLTRGSEGFWFGRPGVESLEMPTFPIPMGIDATGAGDAMRAGILLGFQRGCSTGQSLSLGAAAGALACTRIGGAANAPALADIQALIEEHPGICEKHLQADR